MKKKFFLIATMLFVTVSLASCDDDAKKVIEFNALPESAQTFVNTHFSDKQIAVIYHDRHVTDNEYEVRFSDGAKVDFTRKGEWDEVEDHDVDGVPTAIIPQAINEYIVSKHAGQFTVKISKERKKIEVELNSDIEMVFDKNGEFVSYSD